jgi:hypothetical protein
MKRSRPILPVRSASRPVSVTRRTSGDTATILVRAGEKDLGAITQLGSDADDTLAGNFVNRPAFADVGTVFHELARAEQDGEQDKARTLRAEIAALGVEVWHSVHDMRIDEPGTLTIAAGRARFRPNAAFLMMRTGGL